MASVKGLSIRALMVYGALLLLTHPAPLGPLGAVLHGQFLAFAGAIGALVGLDRYPLQAEFIVRLLLALVGGAALWAIDRHRRSDDEALATLRVELRYVLGAALIAIGLS